MKKVLLILFIIICAYWEAFPQCAISDNSDAWDMGTITPTTTWQQTEETLPADYFSFSATAGYTYYFSFCPADGGFLNKDIDPELTINDNSDNIVAGAYADDDCGPSVDDPYLEWTCTSSGTYKIYFTQWIYFFFLWYDCFGFTAWNQWGYLSYKCSIPSGINCSTPIIVSSYPYTNSNSTCGMLNDEGTQCAGTYGGGEDVVYQLNITTTGVYTISLTNTTGTNYIGWFLKDNANCTTEGSCLDNAVSNATNNANIPDNTYNFAAPGTYYLIVDTKTPDVSCANYTLIITPPFVTCPGGLGTSVVNVTGLLPYNSGAGGLIAGDINDITSANSLVCGGAGYYAAADEVYYFTAASSGNVTFSLNTATSGPNSAIMVYEGCPLNGNGGTCVGYDQSTNVNKSVCAYVTAGRTYYLLVDGIAIYNYASVTISAISASSGNICANAIDISSSLPYSLAGQSTSCYGNDYSNSSPASCGSWYESGQDRVYKYIASDYECLTITLSNTYSYSGFQVYDGCPDVASSTCLGNFNGPTATCGPGNNCSVTGTITLPGAGTYYIIVDNDASTATFTLYDISVSSSAPATNDLPCNATSLTLGQTIAGDNSCSNADGEPGRAICWSNGTLNTVWYSVVAPSSGKLKIRTFLYTTTDALSNTQIALYSGTCSNLSLITTACNDDQNPCGWNTYKNSDLSVSGLTSGTTYYIRVDGYLDYRGTFSIIAEDGSTALDNINAQDCPTPIDACNSTISVGNPGFQAIGNSCDFSSYDYCLLSGERGSVWYRLKINAGGSLAFTIKPNDYDGVAGNETDYDYSLWKVVGTEPLATCATIRDGTAGAAACNYSYLGVTGISTSGGGVAAGYTAAWDESFDALNVSAGDEYLIVISNYSNSTQGFVLTIGGGGCTATYTYSAGSATSLLWTGATSTDWFTASNWGGCSIIPNANTDVIIAPSATVQPVIGADGAVCKSVFLYSGANLTINATRNLDVYGDYHNLGGILNAADASTLTMKSTASTTQIMEGDMTGQSNFGNLTITKTGGSVILIQNIEVAGALTTTDATSDLNGNAMEIKVAGNISFAANSFIPGTNGTVKLYSSNASQTIATNANRLYNLYVLKSAVATLSDNLSLDNDLTIETGTLDVSGSSYSISIYGNGDWLNIGGDFTCRTGTVYFLGTEDQFITSGGDVFYKVVMNKTGKLFLSDPISITGDLVLTSGFFDVSDNNWPVFVSKNWLNDGGYFIPRLGTVTFNGTSEQKVNLKADVVTVNPNDFTFYNLTIDGTDVKLYYNSATYKVNIKNNLVINDNKKLTNIKP